MLIRVVFFLKWELDVGDCDCVMEWFHGLGGWFMCSMEIPMCHADAKNRLQLEMSIHSVKAITNWPTITRKKRRQQDVHVKSNSVGSNCLSVGVRPLGNGVVQG